ncbi:hypothetical protein E4U40_005744 [Claviceps sp. LM458 group G5]|nr:hypothetical protein E4U40_005744 [Claviceps sp. LM458 group G5]
MSGGGSCDLNRPTLLAGEDWAGGWVDEGPATLRQLWGKLGGATWRGNGLELEEKDLETLELSLPSSSPIQISHPNSPIQTASRASPHNTTRRFL